MKKSNRRHFLRNTSLGALAVGVTPNLGKANPTSKKSEEMLDCNITTLDYYGEGPFYTENAPFLENNQLVQPDANGQRIIISGSVRTLDCSQYIGNTLIDIWHADDDGTYDNVGFNFRGRTTSNEQGFYLFETILPGKYLNGAQFRPSHIHFKITPPGFDTLTTQLYFEGDTDIPADAAASINSGTYDASFRIIPLNENADNKMEGTWDIIVDGEGTSTPVTDLHLDKGMIYKVSPNPFTNRVEIFYGVFRAAKVSIEVFDLKGQSIAVLSENHHTPAKYTAQWDVPAALPKGHYFMVLKVNGLQVFYKKITKGS